MRLGTIVLAAMALAGPVHAANAANVIKFTVAGLPATAVVTPSVALAAAALPDATKGQPYSFDFTTIATVSGGLELGDLTWAFSDASSGQQFPAGIALSASTGSFSGTPTTAGTHTFEIIAMHTDGEGRQVYTLLVEGTSLQATQISAGYGHTCAVTPSGGVKCWGWNNSGQLGDGTLIDKASPVDVSGLTSGVALVSAGLQHTCVVTTAGSAKCWGYNAGWQLGDGTATTRSTPVNVSGLTSGVASINAGSNHTCVVTTAGGAKCWGTNSSGQLGDGTATTRSTPVNVSGLTSGVASVDTGENYTCALTTSGGAKCWGYNINGRLGDGTTSNRSTPVNVSGLTSGVATISTGNAHACAVTTSGGAKCWGNNGYGRLGNGSTVESRIPVNVSGLTSGVSSISAGGTNTCAVTTSGGAKCWGYNQYGQLGDGTTTSRYTPVDVTGLTSGVSNVDVGANSSCMIKQGIKQGSSMCWGYNNKGQLGDGTTTNRAVPVDVLR